MFSRQLSGDLGRLAVESVPPADAALGSGANNTARRGSRSLAGASVRSKRVSRALVEARAAEAAAPSDELLLRGHRFIGRLPRAQYRQHHQIGEQGGAQICAHDDQGELEH